MFFMGGSSRLTTIVNEGFYSNWQYKGGDSMLTYIPLALVVSSTLTTSVSGDSTLTLNARGVFYTDPHSKE